jgi:DNA processing protein
MGTAAHFFEVCRKYRIPGVKPEDLKSTAIKEYFTLAECELRFTQENDVRPRIITESDYPNRLKSCEDAPVVLYSRGKMELNAQRMIAVVGTRQATPYGQKCCEEIVAELALHNCTLISGLALGIDSMAHRSAQQLGIPNIGVVAHGLDRIYPVSNSSLARKMENHGGLLTDFPSGTRPDRENFPKRNRIVAGLADAVIVVEAAENGGALITADIAFSYDRDVFAVPGAWGQSVSLGCNQLIRQNKAAILSNASDLAWYLNWDKKVPSAIQTSLFQDMQPDEKKLAACIQSGLDDLDRISIEAGMSISKTSSLLLQMEFAGWVRSLPGKRYQLLS